MSQDIECPKCGKQYRLPDGCGGRKAKCKACGITMLIPEEAKPADSLDELLDEDLRMPSPASMQAAPSFVPPKPAFKTCVPRAKARRRFVLPSVLKSDKVAVFAMVAVVFGGLLVHLGYRDKRLASLSKSTPQTISLRQLIANGPGDNIYMTLTDVRLLPEQAVVQKRRGMWEYVWIPAVVRTESGGADPSQVRIIVETLTPKDERSLLMFCGGTQVLGMLVNATDSIGGKERKLLNEGLRGVDVASCYIFYEGMQPASADLQNGMLGGGSLLLLLGLSLGGLILWDKYLR